VRTKLDLSDDDDENGDMMMEVTRSPKTSVDKTQQQYRLVQSFGSEKQKRFLANARRGIVDSKDLDTSMTSSLETFSYHSKVYVCFCPVLFGCVQLISFCLQFFLIRPNLLNTLLAPFVS